MTNSQEDLFGPVIYSYSRAQALEDGVLVDVTETAREAGFKFPVALTRAVWDSCVELSEAAQKACNDIEGRLWDVLYMGAHAIRSRAQVNEANKDREGIGRQMLYVLRVVQKRTVPTPVELKLVSGPGDDGRPVLTIMLPEED